MLHTAWKFHEERAATHPEIADRVFANSNMDWLLGLLEKLNRDDIINEVSGSPNRSELRSLLRLSILLHVWLALRSV